jgi:hypothetical protein
LCEIGSRIVGAWGLAALIFYVLHAVHETFAGQPESALWACHVATALVGLGLLLRKPTINAIGFLWLVLGVPLWLAEGPALLRFEPTSAAAHLAGLAIGLWGVRRLGLPRPVWWRAALALSTLHVLCRYVTPVEANVNVAFRVWTGWETSFRSHTTYVVSLAAASLVYFGLVEALLRWSGLTRHRERS